MSEQFIKDIEIKDYKCFKDFKAEGFGRVNLIGGKNNIGKTAFMEALYLISNLQDFYLENNKIDREKLYFEIIKTFIDILQNRYGNSFLISWILDNYSLNSFSNFDIKITKKYRLSAHDNIVVPEQFYKYNYGNDGSFPVDKINSFPLFKHQDNQYFYKIRDNKNSPPNIDLFKFVFICNSDFKKIRKLLSKIKKMNKNDLINEYLKKIFNIDKIDITDDEILLFSGNKSYNLFEYGDGVKSFINIILTIFYNKNTTVFLDEIENGIHYTNLDKFWELILTISKEQNVQVFATTHSKECIESYARVSKKLQDNEIAFIELGKNKQNQIRAVVMDSDRFYRELDSENEVRGW